MSQVNIILGPPGTGKTTTLLNLVDEHLARGVRPDRIGFVSFTKKATEEARERAATRFGFNKDDMTYFRTIHSLAFRQGALSPSSVMKRTHFYELGKLLGINITGTAQIEEGNTFGMAKGDRLLFLEGLSRLKCQPLKQVWETDGEDLGWWELDQLSRALAAFKKSNGLVDYTDMLTKFIAEGHAPKFDVLFVDEAQDLSQLQWRVVQKLMANADQVFIAGDDDQAIFRWSGADVDHFIALQGQAKVLDQSYRISTQVHTFATSLIGNLSKRRTKAFKPADHAGTVNYSTGLDDIDLDQGEWLILVRNGYMLKAAEDHCRTAGYFYSCRDRGPNDSEDLRAIRAWERLRKGGEVTATEADLVYSKTSKIQRGFRAIWTEKRTPGEVINLEAMMGKGLQTQSIWHEALDRVTQDDREYFISALRRGEKLQGLPRIRISTIHGSKGGEADNVALFTDLSQKTYVSMQKNPDDEVRVFYVGATRARRNLHIMNPQTNKYFNL